MRIHVALCAVVLVFLTACDRKGTAPSSGAGSSSSATSPSGPAAAKLQLGLNWKPEPQFGGFYAADVQGAFKANNLDVEILQGGSGTPVVQMVIAGQIPYGIASGDEIVIVRDKGQDVVALFAVYQTCPQGILVRADRNLMQLGDVFKGGTLAMQRGLPYSLHLEKTYTFERVTVVPYAGGVATLLDPMKGKDFAQQCFVTSEPILLRQKGVEPKAFLIADSGYDPYTTVVITGGDYAKKNAAEVSKMIKAVRAGWDDYLMDAKPANAVMIKLNPSMDAETFALSAAVQQPLINTEETRKNGLGTMTIERWQKLIGQLHGMGVISKPVPAVEVMVKERGEGEDSLREAERVGHVVVI